MNLGSTRRKVSALRIFPIGGIEMTSDIHLMIESHRLQSFGRTIESLSLSLASPGHSSTTISWHFQHLPMASTLTTTCSHSRASISDVFRLEKEVER